MKEIEVIFFFSFAVLFLWITENSCLQKCQTIFVSSAIEGKKLFGGFTK